jgi:hypothetical protein
MGFARLAAANTARDGSGVVATGFTAGSSGSRIDKITVTSAQATAAASSGMVVRIFISDTSGTNYRLYKEVALATVTASNTAIGATTTITIAGGEVLASGQLVGCTISIYAGVQDQMDFIISGGDL